MRDPTPRVFAVDLRSLAALRIGLGALLLVDLAWRALDLEAHYSDAGVLPRAALAAVLRDPAGMWSLHAASGSGLFQGALFALAALAAAALALGIRSRPAAAVSWLLLVSLHHRNPLVVTGADDVLRLLLFWSLFLPLDARWALRPRAREGSSVCSPASAALLLQVALIYLGSLVFKLRSEEWLALTAIRDALAVEGVASDWGRWLHGHPHLLAGAAAATLVLEALACTLPFLPWRNDALRLLCALALTGLHVLGIAPAMRLGLMPAAMALAWVAFLPGGFWDALGLGARGADRSWRIRDPAPRPLRPGHLLVLAAFAGVVATNAASLAGGRLPAPLPAAIEVLGLSQTWKLWERPIPNRYYVLAATLHDGSRVDLHTGRPLDWERPRRRSRNNRWWKYQLHLSRPYAAALRPWYARHFAARWDRDASPGRRVVHLELVRLRADVPAARPHRLPRQLLWSGPPTPRPAR